MNKIKLERYVFEPLKSNMYLIIEDCKALMIDPLFSVEICDKLKKNNVKEILVILTHEHFDHISGVTELEAYFRLYIIAHVKTQERVSNPNNHIASRYAATFIGKSPEILRLVKEQCKNQIVINVDIAIEQEYDYMWGKHSLHIVSTPGHSLGSICIILDNEYLFTGDSLIPGEVVNTRFPGGDIVSYQEITEPFLRSLNKHLLVFPGHGDSMKLGEMI